MIPEESYAQISAINDSIWYFDEVPNFEVCLVKIFMVFISCLFKVFKKKVCQRNFAYNSTAVQR